MDDIHLEALRKSEIIRAIQELVPPGSPEPHEQIVIRKLQGLTRQLIQAYKANGFLSKYPFADGLLRRIHLYESEVKDRLKDKVVLVSGGKGCLGSAMVEKLVSLRAKRVISLDKAGCNKERSWQAGSDQRPSVVNYKVDVRDYKTMNAVFETEKPEIVFHLAAQRLPWLAELQIRETVTSNVFGTRNVIQLCREHGVQQCVYSSTGKASRYLTSDVYAASKKVCEWLFAHGARQGNVQYGMVRFTHMIENSSCCQQFDDKIARNRIVNVHSPHRYVVGQNISEALHLLLNALVLSQAGAIKFLVCRNLCWPEETLEVALYKILQSGKDLPIYFQGVIPGYEEPFFRGELDWDKPAEVHSLINAVENQSRIVDASGDILTAEAAPFSFSLLYKHLSNLENLTSDPDIPEIEIKQELSAMVKEITRSMFERTAPDLLWKIIKWGTDSRHLKIQDTGIEAYKDVLKVLFEGLYEALNRKNSDCNPHQIPEKQRLPKEEVEDFLSYLEKTSPMVSCQFASIISMLPTFSPDYL